MSLATLQAPAKSTRADHLVIAAMVSRGARVLDVGCGDGDLLELLAERNDVDGRGIELNREGVNACVGRGLSVVQGDADTDLMNYPDQAFDYAVLSLTIQATQRPRHVLEQLLRIGRYAIVSFTNFAHWRLRLQLLTTGRMPVSERLPYAWYDTPNIHLCSIRDFAALCDTAGARIEESVAINSRGLQLGVSMPGPVQNLIGTQAIFRLSRL